MPKAAKRRKRFASFIKLFRSLLESQDKSALMGAFIVGSRAQKGPESCIVKGVYNTKKTGE